MKDSEHMAKYVIEIDESHVAECSEYLRHRISLGKRATAIGKAIPLADYIASQTPTPPNAVTVPLTVWQQDNGDVTVAGFLTPRVAEQDVLLGNLQYMIQTMAWVCGPADRRRDIKASIAIPQPVAVAGKVEVTP